MKETLYIVILIIVLFGCTENEKSQTLIQTSTQSQPDSIGFVKYEKETAIVKGMDIFKKQIDSLSKIVFQSKSSEYKMICDTVLQGTYYDYFNVSGLNEMIKFRFELISSTTKNVFKYSFSINVINFENNQVAKNGLIKAATIRLVQPFGLIKQPNNLFRTKNQLFWFSTSFAYSSKVYKQYLTFFKDLFTDSNTEYIDSQIAEKHLDSNSLKELYGTYNTIFLSTIYSSDEEIKPLDIKIAITDSTISFDEISISYKLDTKRLIPDIQTFLRYRNELMEIPPPISDKLIDFVGSYHELLFDFSEKIELVEDNRVGLLRNPDIVFLQGSSSHFFLWRDQLYKMEKVK